MKNCEKHISVITVKERNDDEHRVALQYLPPHYPHASTSVTNSEFPNPNPPTQVLSQVQVEGQVREQVKEQVKEQTKEQIIYPILQRGHPDLLEDPTAHPTQRDDNEHD